MQVLQGSVCWGGIGQSPLWCSLQVLTKTYSVQGPWGLVVPKTRVPGVEE